MIEVWEPLYRTIRTHGTPTVLVSRDKVRKGKNIIKITKGAYKGQYRMSEIAIRSYPQASNGTIMCYALPLEKMEKIT